MLGSSCLRLTDATSMNSTSFYANSTTTVIICVDSYSIPFGCTLVLKLPPENFLNLTVHHLILQKVDEYSTNVTFIYLYISKKNQHRFCVQLSCLINLFLQLLYYSIFLREIRFNYLCLLCHLTLTHHPIISVNIH